MATHSHVSSFLFHMGNSGRKKKAYICRTEKNFISVFRFTTRAEKSTKQVGHYRPAGEDAIGNQSGMQSDLVLGSAKLGADWPPVWDNVLAEARECSFV